MYMFFFTKYGFIRNFAVYIVQLQLQKYYCFMNLTLYLMCN